MDESSILSKTAKGMRLLVEKDRNLPAELLALLRAIDGRSTLSELQPSLNLPKGVAATSIAKTLVSWELVRVLGPILAAVPEESTQDHHDLDFSHLSADLDFTDFRP